MTALLALMIVALIVVSMVDIGVNAEPNTDCARCNWQTLIPGSLRWCACCADSTLKKENEKKSKEK
jgi:hypothetical protein